MDDFLTPEWKAPACIRALSTTRRGGVSAAPYDDGAGGGGFNLGLHVGDDPRRVLENRARLRARLPAEPAWLTQVHGTRVVRAEQAASVSDALQADAAVTAVPGTVCAIQTADCLPVLLADADGRAVGVAHAGWRGLAHGVLENTVAALHEAGAGDILAWLGPAIGPQRFEVGQEVFDAFAGRDAELASAFVSAGRPGKYFADLYALAARILRKAGVRDVAGGGFCTASDVRRFYSYRRDGVTGRMATLIWIE